MCHHIDLAIFLGGCVIDLDKIIIDNNKFSSECEECIVILKHESGLVSKISYSTFKSPFWEKEAIWFSNENDYILVKDFKLIKSNLFNLSFEERDKGCLNMWKKIKYNINMKNNFNDWKKIDFEVYKVMSKILF